MNPDPDADVVLRPSGGGGMFWPVYALAWRELVRFFRQRTRVVGAVGQPVIFWVLFGNGLGQSFNPPDWASGLSRPLSYQEYFFPGIAVLIVLFTAIFSTISIIEDRREGFLQGVLAAPVPRLSLVLGKLVGGSVLAIIQAGLAPALDGGLTWGTAPEVFGFLFLVAMELTALGFVIAWPMDSTQGYHAIMSVLLLPMWLISGAFFPAPDSGWLSWLIRLNPLSYGVAALRRLMHPEPLPVTGALPGLGVCLSVTLVTTVILMIVAVALARRPTSRDAR